MILEPPDNWGKNSLGEHLQLTLEQQFATFHNKPESFAQLTLIDGLYLKVSGYLKNPKDMMAALCLLRSHSAYRASCSLVLGTQLAESFATMRVCLEYSGYAVYMNTHTGIDMLFLKRHESEENKSLLRKAFTHSNIRECIKGKSDSQSKVYDRLYNQLIDYGAHPNERALIFNAVWEELENGDIKFSQIYNHGDPSKIESAIKTLAQVGVCSLINLQTIFSEKFELLGISHEIEQLKKVL